MYRYLIACFGLLLIGFGKVNAADVPIGFHLLDPGEIELTLPFRGVADKSFFVTVPMSIYDRRTNVWNDFFRTARRENITPIIRWVTAFEDGNWKIPTRKDVVEVVKFMSYLDWNDKRIIVLFNEPNHAAEWGGTVDPEGYASLALFSANWLKTESDQYLVLPAGLDGDAPTNQKMMNSFLFIDRMFASEPDLFTVIDAWTSHSYPNPGFSGSASSRGKNSMYGFMAELDKIQRLTGRKMEVFITETGWKQNLRTVKKLPGYYREAVNRVWTDKRIKAVTVFVLKGTNGPFAEFSLLDENNMPTAQMRALQMALDRK